MNRAKALAIYVDLLRRFQNELSNSPSDIEGTLEGGLGYLMDRLRLQNACLFWWDSQRQLLSMQYTLQDGLLMEGEEEIQVNPSSALDKLVHSREPVILSIKKPWVAFIPLIAGSEVIGAIRLQRPRPLVRGRAIKELPAYIGSQTSTRSYPLLEDIASVLSLRLQHLRTDEKHQKRTRYLRASSEVATAVFERPRLRDMLEAVARSIVQNLGFDRVRVFLTNSDGKRVDGVLGIQIPDKLVDLTEETYELKRNHNQLVEAMLTSGKEANIQLVGGRVVYVPLIVNGEAVGCMIADNLLSQQLIDEEQLEALRALAGQIGMAVLNSRLFEDIEQQAITDGLTKLYVHRYFQQRLKEEIDRADRYSYSVALIMMDVDNFKTLNDKYGHLMGDKVLEFLSQTIRANIRRIDLAARYGGDEVVLVLPEITEQEAWLMAERLLNAVKKGAIPTPDGGKVHMSVTMGAAMYATDAHSGRDLIEAADKALYWGKKNSRGNLSFYRNTITQSEKTA